VGPAATYLPTYLLSGAYALRFCIQYLIPGNFPPVQLPNSPGCTWVFGRRRKGEDQGARKSPKNNSQKLLAHLRKKEDTHSNATQHD
jgi:hypothetical protein